MAAKKGHEKKGGRQKGSLNKFTKTVKEVVLGAFNEMQEDPKANILAWGKENPKDFYNIAAKLIPTELGGSVGVYEATPLSKDEIKKVSEDLDNEL